MSSTEYKPTATFHNAAAYLSSASSLSKVATAVKLELYGLFKYLTTAKSPNTSRPSLFDMTGRAKWDAWAAAGKAYQNPTDAEKRYLEIATTLGWKETEGSSSNAAAQLQEQKGTKEVDNIDLENLSDDEDNTPKRSSGHTSSGGLGITVSTLNKVGEQCQPEDHSLHGLAVSGELTGLRLLLDSSKDLDLNALDEYGYAPIHLACDRGHVEVVKILLARGASKEVKDPDGLTPLELAQEAGRDGIAKLLESNS